MWSLLQGHFLWSVVMGKTPPVPHKDSVTLSDLDQQSFSWEIVDLADQ